MKKIVFIAAVAALYWFKPELFPFGSHGGEFDGASNPEVVIFTFDGCGAPCGNAVTLLKDKGINFENVDVGASRENEQRLRSLGGGSRLPITFIGSQRVDGFHEQRLNEALSLVYGLDVLDQRTREVIATHYNEDGSPKVVMYGASWCPYCKKAREFFERENVHYSELDVEADATAAQRYEVIKSSGYPLIYVGAKRFEGLDKRGVLQAIESGL